MLEVVPSARFNGLHDLNKPGAGTHHLGLSGEESGLIRSSQHGFADSLNSDLSLVQSSKVRRLQSFDHADDPLRLSKSLPLSSDKHHHSFSLGSETVGDMVASRFDPLLNGGKSRKKGSAGNTLKTAQRVKLTNQWHTITDSVGSSDRFDFYCFKLNTGSSFHLKLAGEQNTVDVVLLNASGQVIKDLSGPFGKNRVALHTALDAGTYYLKVTGHDSDTDYQLSLSGDPGGARRSAQLIHGNQKTLVNTVGSTDRSDMYRFVVDKKSTVQCNLTGLKANADLVLMDSQGQVIQASRHFGKKDESIAATLEQGIYYVKVTGWGKETKYRLNLSVQEAPTLPIPKSSAPGTGIFTVGETGKVSIDYLFDGSASQGELAIFNLKGMEQYGIGSKRYMQEAMLRALGNSPDSGYVAILDQTEGARFSSSPGEPNFNAGEYRGTKTFTMNPGDKFGIMLVPNGTMPDTLFNSDLSGDQRPLFSMPEANLESAIQLAQVVDVVADGNSFAFEDTSLTNNSDRNYGDIIFQLRGAIGSAAFLNDVTTSAKDWRNSDVGKQVETYAAANRYGPLTNIGSELASLFVEYETYVRNGGVPSAFKPTNFLLQVQGGQVVIDAIASDSANSLLTDLQSLGLQRAAAFEPVVSGSLPIEKLIDAARLGSLLFAKPAYRPTTNVGATDSQGDRAMRSDVARTNLGVNGAGVTVGVLSDSFNNPDPSLPPLLTDADADINSGDLPAVNVLDDSVPATDEGRAMLQLIHDVAPRANLAFHTAYGGMANFAQGIIDLANAGADVIVDDVNTFGAPIFQDGIVAQAVDRVVSQGVAYFTSAGNAGSSAYSSAFTPSGQNFAGSTGLEVAHDFDPGSGVDTHQRITIPTNSNFSVTLQWDSPWRSTSVSSPGSRNDVNIYLVSPAGNIVARSDGSEIGQDAIAVLAFNNNPAQNLGNQFDLVITNASGTNPGLVSYFSGGGTINEFATNSPTIAWHRNAAGAETVGAAYYPNTPVFGTDPAVLKNDSSVGTIPILFDVNGNRLSIPEIRLKPEIVAPDGTNTTFFGEDSDSDVDGFPNFFGTSAAAPHAAAVAALMFQAVPGSSPINIYRALEETALDMEPFGVDNATGFGLIRADQAIARLQSLALPTVTISATDAQAFESGDSAQFIINRSGGDINRELIVNYTFGSTATNGIDYLESGSSDLPPRPLSGTVLFRPGVTSTSISVTPINDNIAEGVETLDLTISQNLTYNIGIANQARATVVDDSLVIDRVLMSSTPQSGTWLYSFDASSGNSGDSFHIPNQEYEGNNLTVPMEDLQLPNITVGDVINFSMRLDDDEEDVTTPRAENQSSSSFIASFSGEQSFRFPDDWIYTIFWRMV